MNFNCIVPSLILAVTSLSASAAPVSLPERRVLIGKTNNAAWVVSTVPEMMGGMAGIGYSYPDTETELDHLILQARSAGDLVYDLRDSQQSTPIPTAPYHTDGYELSRVVAVTEFPSIRGAADMGNFLLFLTSGVTVTDFSDHVDLTIGTSTRSYWNPAAAAIKAAKAELIDRFQINWQSGVDR